MFLPCACPLTRPTPTNQSSFGLHRAQSAATGTSRDPSQPDSLRMISELASKAETYTISDTSAPPPCMRSTTPFSRRTCSGNTIGRSSRLLSAVAWMRTIFWACFLENGDARGKQRGRQPDERRNVALSLPVDGSTKYLRRTVLRPGKELHSESSPRMIKHPSMKLRHLHVPKL